MRAQEEGGRPQDKERGLRGNQACHYFKLRFLDSRTMGEKKKNYYSSQPLDGILLWQS